LANEASQISHKGINMSNDLEIFLINLKSLNYGMTKKGTSP